MAKLFGLVQIFTAWKALKFRVIFEKLYLRQFISKHFEILKESILLYLLNKCKLSKHLAVNLRRYSCSKKSHFLCPTVYIYIYIYIYICIHDIYIYITYIHQMDTHYSCQSLCRRRHMNEGMNQ